MMHFENDDLGYLAWTKAPSFRLERGRDEPPNKTQRPYWLKRLCLQAQIDNLRQMGELLRNELEHLNSQADRLLLTQSAPAAPAKLAGWLRRLAG